MAINAGHGHDAMSTHLPSTMTISLYTLFSVFSVYNANCAPAAFDCPKNFVESRTLQEPIKTNPIQDYMELLSIRTFHGREVNGKPDRIVCG